MSWISSAWRAALAVGLGGCAGRVGQDADAGRGGLTGSSSDSAADASTAETSIAPPSDAVSDETTCGVDFSARLAAAEGDCSAPTPTRVVDGDEAAIAAFEPFIVGRWLACPSSTGPAIPGPVGNVGIEFTADGRAYFLRVACDGSIVRGSGGEITDSTPLQTWDNWYEILDPGGQLNVYYGAPPSGGWSLMNIVHGRFGDGPKRVWFDDEGVYESMYVVAPDRI